MPESAVVVDTNVFVGAGFNPRSASAKIVEAVKQGQVRMVWNDDTRRETERIMHQIPRLRGHSVAELFRPEDRFTAPTHPERFGPGLVLLPLVLHYAGHCCQNLWTFPRRVARGRFRVRC